MVGQPGMMMTTHGGPLQRPQSMDGLHRLQQPHHPQMMQQQQPTDSQQMQPAGIMQQQQHPTWPAAAQQHQPRLPTPTNSSLPHHRPNGGTSVIHKPSVGGGVHPSGHMIGIPLSEAMMSPAVTNGNFGLI